MQPKKFGYKSAVDRKVRAKPNFTKKITQQEEVGTFKKEPSKNT